MRKPNELFAKHFLVNSVVKFMALKKKSTCLNVPVSNYKQSPWPKAFVSLMRESREKSDENEKEK